MYIWLATFQAQVDVVVFVVFVLFFASASVLICFLLLCIKLEVFSYFLSFLPFQIKLSVVRICHYDSLALWTTLCQMLFSSRSSLALSLWLFSFNYVVLFPWVYYWAHPAEYQFTTLANWNFWHNLCILLSMDLFLV